MGDVARVEVEDLAVVRTLVKRDSLPGRVHHAPTLTERVTREAVADVGGYCSSVARDGVQRNGRAVEGGGVRGDHASRAALDERRGRRASGERGVASRRCRDGTSCGDGTT